MKQIGRQIGVNESRVSQLHARAIDRLRRMLATPDQIQKPRLVSKTTRPKVVRRPAARQQPALPKVA